MFGLNKISIERKLLFILVGISSLSLLFAAVVMIWYDSENLKSQIVNELRIVAEIVADRSSASLIFSDTESAESNLAALNVQSNIVYACIRDSNNDLFAEYHKDHDVYYLCENFQSSSGSEIFNGFLDVYQNIVLDNQKIGLLHIKTDLSELNKRVVRDIIIVLGVLFCVLVIVVLTSKKFLVFVSKPIIDLAKTAKEVSNNQDFSLRAHKSSEDEIGVLVEAFNEMLMHIESRDLALLQEKEKAESAALSAKEYAVEVEKSNKDLESEISERRRIENELQELNETLEQRVQERTAELESLNERIGEIARSAGMAEVASGVLHNVGNVLNSVNVSASVIRDLVRKSKVNNLSNLVLMLREHEDDIGSFIENDPKGSKIPRFLSLLAEQLEQEKRGLFGELDVLANNIDHIKNVISMQQSYAGSYGVLESVKIDELIEDALKINMEGMDRHNIIIEKVCENVPSIFVDKHKALQIIINLISNAKHALVDSSNKIKKLIIHAYQKEDLVYIEVSDTGVGISESDIQHLFEYGFKKRKGGHGYGLHHSAITANELGGKITVSSEGLDKGASFTFVLPVDIREQS